METKALPIGIDNFEMLITRNYYYIDKTLLIKDLLDNKGAVNLFTRPRRFGKTLNMSMLQYFFEKRDEDNSYLFKNLNIMKAGEKYTSHIGQYPVINLSLKSSKQPNFDLAFKCIKDEIESALKTNPYLEFAVIIGCLRISKESIFTGLNNLEIISILNKSYDEYFGFTQNEVNKMLQDYNLENKEDLVREWYNGYLFGNANVYNPWSAVRFVKDLKVDENTFPTSYWANTSSNSIVRSLIEKADSVTKKEIELLIEGKTIEKPVH